MQVLLLKDVKGLGEAGDIKEVAGGYARNYLLAQKLATPVTEGALKQAQSLREAAARRRERKLTEAKAIAAKLDGTMLHFSVRAGEGDRLYGSVTSGDVAEALTQATGIEIDRRIVDLEHPIKALGEHDVIVKLGAGIAAKIHAIVERSEEPA